jgi:hypothetical protein
MKTKIVFFLSFTLLIFSAKAQNTLLLKSGEKINGLVDKIDGGALTFDFKGNKMKFNITDVSVIYFDDKVTQASENLSTISGVVTYYFNQNYGDKPDVGAEIYIVDSLKCPEFNKAIVDSFSIGSFYKSVQINRSYFITSKQEVAAKLKEYKIESKEAFEAFDKRASDNIYKLENSKNTYKLVADGNGNYSKKLNAGTYYVLIRSKHRNGIFLTNIMGKIYLQTVKIAENEDVAVNYNFSIY